MQRLRVLDSFRGLCAIALMVYHSHALCTFTEAHFFRAADRFVEFFFILSGFVLALTYANRLKSVEQLHGFIVSRIFRLYPLHLVMLAVFIGLEFMKLMAERHGIAFTSAAFSGARAPSEIVPNLFLLQSWWAGFNPMSFNYPSWSISVEFYLYLLFAAITFWLPGQARLIGAAIALIAFAALQNQSQWQMTEYSLRGLSCFFAGQLVYTLYEKIKDVQLDRPLATALEVLALVTIFCVMSYATEHREAILVGLFCLTVVLFSFEAGEVSALMCKPLFTRLGTLSFSIYMVHAAVLFVTPLALGIYSSHSGIQLLTDQVEAATGTQFRYIDTGSVLINTVLVLVPMLLTIALANLSYRYIEMPGIALGKRLRKARLAPVMPGGASLG
ncbi:acyltransferase [Pseudomonas sp. HR96]|uniref:acyltransferase family protein n=1 Tax=Pseudomonas sp. HR96 TaxID=1027966 RepID=UPI002A750228|nr:acyltransferase [Pseudomonas sp. HR96]WPO98467.1 acyltransferase [Pseudomonas sp. HR96]